MLWSELHLGAPLPEWGPLGEGRRDLLKAALEDAVDTAISQNVDAILCSGDLFDRPDPDTELAQFALGHFAQVLEAGVALVFLPGRYDSLSHPGCFYHGDLPKEICVVDWAQGRRTEIQTKGGPLQLYSLAWRPGITPQDFWKDLRRDPEASGSHVGLLHAHAPWSTVPLANGLSVTLEDIASSDLDLMVLGGPHNFHEEISGRTQVVAAGTPTGLGFGEWDDRRWCLANIDDGVLNLETLIRKVPPVERLDIKVEAAWNLEKIKETVTGRIVDGSLVELHLSGQSESPLVGEAVLEALSQRECVVDLIDEVEMVLPEHFSMSVLDIFIRNMQKRMEKAGEDQRSILRRALKVGLKTDAAQEIVHAD